MEKIRLLIVDDQILFLESLSTFLRNYAADIEVVGLARNGI
jgi:DNA-binding NarL/FixJ family response regulator